MALAGASSLRLLLRSLQAFASAAFLLSLVPLPFLARQQPLPFLAAFLVLLSPHSLRHPSTLRVPLRPRSLLSLSPPPFPSQHPSVYLSSSSSSSSSPALFPSSPQPLPLPAISVTGPAAEAPNECHIKIDLLINAVPGWRRGGGGVGRVGEGMVLWEGGGGRRAGARACGARAGVGYGERGESPCPLPVPAVSGIGVAFGSRRAERAVTSRRALRLLSGAHYFARSSQNHQLDEHAHVNAALRL